MTGFKDFADVVLKHLAHRDVGLKRQTHHLDQLGQEGFDIVHFSQSEHHSQWWDWDISREVNYTF